MPLSLGKIIAITYRNGDRYLDKKLKALSLGCGQFRILAEMQDSEIIKQIELANRMGIDKTTIARTIKKLEELKYINRIPNINDTRSYDIVLTTQGKIVRKKLMKILNDYTKKLLHGLSENQIKTLFKLMMHVQKNSHDLL